MRGALPLKVKYIKNKTDKNVLMEVNSNDMDRHRIKTVYRSYYHGHIHLVDVNNDKFSI